MSDINYDDNGNPYINCGGGGDPGGYVPGADYDPVPERREETQEDIFPESFNKLTPEPIINPAIQNSASQTRIKKTGCLTTIISGVTAIAGSSLIIYQIVDYLSR